MAWIDKLYAFEVRGGSEAEAGQRNSKDLPQRHRDIYEGVVVVKKHR
jgi:hypothetical protein